MKYNIYVVDILNKNYRHVTDETQIRKSKSVVFYSLHVHKHVQNTKHIRRLQMWKYIHMFSYTIRTVTCLYYLAFGSKTCNSCALAKMSGIRKTQEYTTN